MSRRATTAFRATPDPRRRQRGAPADEPDRQETPGAWPTLPPLDAAARFVAAGTHAGCACTPGRPCKVGCVVCLTQCPGQRRHGRRDA